MNPANEIIDLLTTDCDRHPAEYHRALFDVLTVMNPATLFTMHSQFLRMKSDERIIAERVLTILAGTHFTRLERGHCLRIAVDVVTLSLSIANQVHFSFDDLNGDRAKKEIHGYCVENIASFVTDQIIPSSPIWMDGDVVRGRFFTSMSRLGVVPPREELKWIGEHSMELSEHIKTLKGFKKLDRELCEHVLSTPNPLVSGVL